MWEVDGAHNCTLIMITDNILTMAVLWTAWQIFTDLQGRRAEDRKVVIKTPTQNINLTFKNKDEVAEAY